MQNKLGLNILLKLLQGGLIIIPLAFYSTFFQPFEGVKWSVFFILATISSALLAFNTNRISLLLPRHELIWMMALVLTFSLAIFKNMEKEYSTVILEWCAFCSIALASFIVNSSSPHCYQKFRIALYFSALISVLYSSIQILNIESIKLFPHPSFPSAFFGFQNLYSEFLGIVSLLLIFDIMYSKKSSKYIYILSLIFILIALSLQQTRAVYIALLLSLVFFINATYKIRKSIFLILGLVITIGISFFAGRNLILYSVEQISLPTFDIKTTRTDLGKIKAANSQTRLIRWRNSLNMLHDYPMGVGPDKFSYSYLSYYNSYSNDYEVTDQKIVKSPHNGYLEYFVENGWIAGIILIGYLLHFFRLRTIHLSLNRKSICLRTILIFFLVDALFSFPMEVPFPFYIIAIGLGYWLKHSRYEYNLNYPMVKFNWKWLKMGSTALFITLLTIGARYAYANFVLSYSNDDLKSVGQACEIYPDMWQNCYQLARINGERGNYTDALKILSSMLKKEPNLFLAVHLTAMTAFKMGNKKLGCQSLMRYEEILPHQWQCRMAINSHSCHSPR